VETKADFTPLVDPEVFDRAQLFGRVKLTERRRNVREHPDFPLRAFVRCSHCSTYLTGSWSRGRSAKYPYYRCPGCGKVSVRCEALEAQFLALLSDLRPRPEFSAMFRQLVTEASREYMDDARQRRRAAETTLSDLRRRQEQLDDAHIFKGSIDEMTYREQRDRLREAVALAQLERSDATVEELDVSGVLEFADTVVQNAALLWKQANVAQRRRLQATLLTSGIEFDGQKFGTVVTCCAFYNLTEADLNREGVASPAGFEPASPP
jgi:site-specific DNA recombinase